MNEYHEIGIKMVANLFDFNGWETLFLGNNLPTEDLVSEVKKHSLDLLGISLSMTFNVNNLEEAVKKLNQEFPELKILVGGMGLNEIKDEFLKKYPGLIIYSDFNTLLKIINE